MVNNKLYHLDYITHVYDAMLIVFDIYLNSQLYKVTH